jgi:hypothetical protein
MNEMIRSGTLQSAEPNPGRAELEPGYLIKTTLFSSPPHERPSPHAYLIEQSPNSFARSHFHHNSEFQVIVRGSGQFGRHDVRPYTVHYAGQQTGYGPLSAGDDGLAYLTLRPVTEFGIWYLPESREYMDPRIRRGQVSSECLLPSDTHSLAALATPHVEIAIEPKASGLAAWRVRVPPENNLPIPAHDNGAGRFYMIAGGTLRCRGMELPELGTLWVSQDEPAFEAVAGAAGADVLVMQFPANAWEFPDPPVRRD